MTRFVRRSDWAEYLKCPVHLSATNAGKRTAVSLEPLVWKQDLVVYQRPVNPVDHQASASVLVLCRKQLGHGKAGCRTTLAKAI